MVDIRKTTPVQDKDLRSQLDRKELIEALRHGNIYEVFAKSKAFKISDFLDFFADQWRSWRGGVVQDGEIKAQDGSLYEPDLGLFPVHHREASLSPEEGEYWSRAMRDFLASHKGGFKAQTTLGGGESTGPTDSMTADELEEIARGTLGDWEQFMQDTWSQIIDAQMMSDYKSKMAEIRQEVERIISLAKEGRIAPEFVLIALAKVNATKNGVLFTWLGKKAFNVNESLTKIANDLHTIDRSDPRYASELQLGQAKTRDGAFQLSLLQTDMQKVMQDVAGVLEQVHGIMGELQRTRRDIITKVAAQG